MQEITIISLQSFLFEFVINKCNSKVTFAVKNAHCNVANSCLMHLFRKKLIFLLKCVSNIATMSTSNLEKYNLDQVQGDLHLASDTFPPNFPSNFSRLDSSRQCTDRLRSLPWHRYKLWVAWAGTS